MESLSTKERVYILKGERDFDQYERDLIEEKESLEKELTEKTEKLKELPEDDEHQKAIDRLEKKISQLEMQIKGTDEKIAEIPARKAFVEKYGPTKWAIKSMSRLYRANLMTAHGIGGKEDAPPLNVQQYLAAVVKTHLVGCENYRHKETGELIAFFPELYEYLPEETFGELSAEIGGGIEGKFAKNS